MTKNDSKNNGSESRYKRKSVPLDAAVGGSLNPMWCEWLMNFPEGWTSLNDMSHIEYLQWLMLFCFKGSEDANAVEKGKSQAMRSLREGHVAEEIQRTTGGLVSVYEAAVLLALLFQHKERIDEARLFMACAKTLENEMRSVRSSENATGSPSGSRHNQQRENQYSNIMQVLPRLLAYHSKKTWMGYCRETGETRTSTMKTSRVDRLAGLGNAQVPAVVALAWKLLTGTVRDSNDTVDV